MEHIQYIKPIIVSITLLYIYAMYTEYMGKGKDHKD